MSSLHDSGVSGKLGNSKTGEYSWGHKCRVYRILEILENSETRKLVNIHGFLIVGLQNSRVSGKHGNPKDNEYSWVHDCRAYRMQEFLGNSETRKTVTIHGFLIVESTGLQSFWETRKVENW